MLFLLSDDDDTSTKSGGLLSSSALACPFFITTFSLFLRVFHRIQCQSNWPFSLLLGPSFCTMASQLQTAEGTLTPKKLKKDLLLCLSTQSNYFYWESCHDTISLDENNIDLTLATRLDRKFETILMLHNLASLYNRNNRFVCCVLCPA